MRRSILTLVLASALAIVPMAFGQKSTSQGRVLPTNAHTRVLAAKLTPVQPTLAHQLNWHARKFQRRHLHKVSRHYRAYVRAAQRAQLARQQAAQQRAAIATVGKGTLAAIVACESGGNPQAVSPKGGKYRGLFQFDSTTWQSVGGSGDPAAAPAEEQYRRAAMLYARSGSSPWPECGR